MLVYTGTGSGWATISYVLLALSSCVVHLLDPSATAPTGVEWCFLLGSAGWMAGWGWEKPAGHAECRYLCTYRTGAPCGILTPNLLRSFQHIFSTQILRDGIWTCSTTGLNLSTSPVVRNGLSANICSKLFIRVSKIAGMTVYFHQDFSLCIFFFAYILRVFFLCYHKSA